MFLAPTRHIFVTTGVHARAATGVTPCVFLRHSSGSPDYMPHYMHRQKDVTFVDNLIPILSPTCMCMRCNHCTTCPMLSTIIPGRHPHPDCDTMLASKGTSHCQVDETRCECNITFKHSPFGRIRSQSTLLTVLARQPCPSELFVRHAPSSFPGCRQPPQEGADDGAPDLAKAACARPSSSLRYSARTRCAYEPLGRLKTNTSILRRSAPSSASSPTCAGLTRLRQRPRCCPIACAATFSPICAASSCPCQPHAMSPACSLKPNSALQRSAVLIDPRNAV